MKQNVNWTGRLLTLSVTVGVAFNCVGQEESKPIVEVRFELR
jgi:hypothetical protein